MKRALLGPVRAAFRPISDYGVIGDLRSVALVSTDGSIDWWCPRRFDAPSVFAALLDRERGGFFRVAPAGRFAASSRYVEDTNVLETTFRSSHAEVRLVDLAPFSPDVGSDAPVLLRRVTCIRGEVDVDVEFAPRFDYGRVAPRFAPAPEGGHLARGNGETLLLRGADLRPDGQALVGRLHLQEGQTVNLFLQHRGYVSPGFDGAAQATAADLERLTIKRWRDWSAHTRATGRYADAVKRSALVLKLLTYEPTGAVIAAPTTSLPEAIGGVRNWDYRYTWVRDAAFSVRALFEVGHPEEAKRFVEWMIRTAADHPNDLRIMYGLHGELDLDEHELPHLGGYRGTAPVRVGNGAATQRQLDIYGELFDSVHACRAWGFDVETERWTFFRTLADWVVDHWREPDSGIWEVRSEPRHFVLSKAMAWAALDRAAQAAREHDLPGDVGRWEREAEAIRRMIEQDAYDPEMGAYRQAFGESTLDASNLLLPLIGVVDPHDPRMVSTVDRTLEVLTVDGLVYRYLDTDDGLPGGEATFTYCTFWLVEVLAMQGRLAEARDVMNRVLDRASHLGLFAEELEPHGGEHLGNYPQAFPHIGLILAALRLEAAARGEDVTAPVLHHELRTAPTRR